MHIGFVGDIHGRVLHTQALLAAWQQKMNQKLDFIIQVGDLGAYPIPDEVLMKEKYVREDPAELDFSRMLRAEGELAEWIVALRKNELNPIHFIRGNHEDFDWLDSLGSSAEQVVSVDPFNLFYYVKDGTIIHVNDMKIAFIGGIQTKEYRQKSIDPNSYERLSQLRPGEVDILVTHDAPYGIGISYLGETQGSIMISNLIETIQPKYAIGGHYHHMIGPKLFGNTIYLGLNVLVDLRKDGLLRRVQPGCLAILDTDMGSLSFVTEDWLSEMDKDFEFISYMNSLKGSDFLKSNV
ncbi:metallophosphoesterase [Paenibacillus sp. RC67]|uniref:metallophosphoesterase family protein n=1 Tax=Paenibacillus sp. RC67 TaxID=3039392 RepID=UPI0024ADC05F|nr:metallophosphoesterase [Paenibacillus sp. RC67]